MARRTWFSLFRTLFGGISSNQTKQAQRPNLALEQMEDRWVPATASLINSDQIVIDFTATGSTTESVSLTNSGGTISLTGNITGTTSFTTSAIKSILASASGNSSAQTLTFAAGTTLTLDNGLSTTGVDFVIFNNAIDASGGSASISVNAPTQIEISSNLTGGTGGVSLVGGGSSTGDTDGVLILGSGTTITATASGNVSVNGSGGSGSGSANYGVFVQGSITSGGGNVSVTGTGGSGNGGTNVGVNVQPSGKITAGGAGTVTVNGKSQSTYLDGSFDSAKLYFKAGNYTQDTNGGSSVGFEALGVKHG